MLNANRVTLLMALLLLIGACKVAAEQNDFDARYQRALKHARSGDLQTSLTLLAELVRSNPDTPRYRYDYIQVLSWANRYSEVLKQSHVISLANSPNYVLHAVARALRHTKQFNKTEKVYRIILSRTPRDISAQVGLAQVYIDQGRTQLAMPSLLALQDRHLDNIDILFALAYANERNKNFPAALSYYETILEIQPHHKASIRGRDQALQQIASMQRQHAIDLAQAGDYASALEEMNLLLDDYPGNKSYIFDYLQILSWAGQDEAILDYSRKMKLAEAPDYVLEVIARSARNLKQFNFAEKLYRRTISRTPGRINPQVGLALVLIDQAHNEEALKILQQLQKKHPENISILAALAYASNTDKDYLAAFAYYDNILAIDPQHRESLRGSVFAINALGATRLAFKRANKNRELFSEEEWVKLQWDASAALVRWGEVAPEKEGQRFYATDNAISAIKVNLQSTDNFALQNPEIWSARARFDLIVALRDRSFMQEVVEQFRILQEQGVILPVYAEIAAGDAFLYLQEPDKARDLYLSALTKDANNYRARLSLVYAYVEAEQHDEAIQAAAEIAAEQPEKLKFRDPQGLVYTRGNPEKTKAELVAAVARAFADDLKYAQPRLQDMHDNAPFNPNIGNELANLYYYRGWPRLAKERYASDMNVDPKHIGLKTGYVRSAFELREYRETEKKTYALGLNYPENKGVQRALRRWDIHNMREFKIFSNGGFNSGSVQGSEDVNLDNFLYSQPLNYNYRMFAHVRWQTALFEEGRGYNTRYGLGLEYRRPNIIVASELHYDNSATNTLGFAANIDYQFNDFWQLGAGIDGRSGETPLRALNDGVTANSAYLRLGYRFHESRRLDLSTQVLPFSDDNFRSMINGNYYERWFSGPIYKFATIIGAGYSHNSKGSTRTDPGLGTIYFNPKNDSYFSLTLDNDWLTYRFYDLVFNQRLAVTAGSYWQDGYGASAVGNVLYEHRWMLPRDLLEFNYGAVRYTRVYDGDREHGWNFYLNLNLRF